MKTKKYDYCFWGDKIPIVLRNEKETYEFEIYNYGKRVWVPYELRSPANLEDFCVVNEEKAFRIIEEATKWYEKEYEKK